MVAISNLSDLEQEWLLCLVKTSIEAQVQRRPLPTLEGLLEDDKSLSAAERLALSQSLNNEAGAFVSVYIDGKLRGCIGNFREDQALCELVQSMAILAATRDSRFTPVGESELEHLNCEISVLTPITPVEDLDDIEIGRDGLVVESKRHRGVLLPQVATQYGWDRDEFLSHTCQKAALPFDAWQKDPDLRISRFQAIVFSDKADAQSQNHC